MRKIFLCILILMSSAGSSFAKVDVDFSKFSSTMVYSAVIDMLARPNSYLGKNIRITGYFDAFRDEETGNNYFGVLIMDASACCGTGLDFVLKDKYKYPQDYPELGAEITVTGKFEKYTEDNETLYRLANADMVLM